MSDASDDPLDETYTYDASGRLDIVTRGDGTYTDYDWTLNGEQSQVTEFDAQNVATECQEFAWGGVGDRTLESVTFSESDGSGGLAPQGRVEYDYDHAGEKIARRVYDADGALLSHRKYLVDHQNPTGYSQTLAELEIVDPDTGRPSEAADAAARVARLNTFDPLGPVAQTDFQQTDTGLLKTYRLDSGQCRIQGTFMMASGRFARYLAREKRISPRRRRDFRGRSCFRASVLSASCLNLVVAS